MSTLTTNKPVNRTGKPVNRMGKPENRTGAGNPDGIRKAAILVSALDRNMVDTLLDQMGPAQAGLVRQAVIELDDIDAAEQERVIEEFFELGPGLPDKRPAGVELDGRLARRFSQDTGEDRGAAANQEPSDDGSTDDGPSEFLSGTQSEGLAEILKSERPQTVALVLSRMSPHRAGKVLVQFSPDMQAEVVRRLVDLEETDPDILHEIEGELQKRLSQKLHMQRRRVAGVSAVTGILEAASTEIGTTILRNVAARDKHLAQRFATGGLQDDYTADKGPTAPHAPNESFSPQPPPRIDFMDLAAMDADTLFTITENVDREILVLALLGAPAHLMDRVLRQMPHTRAAAIRGEIENIGPVRLGDVDEARRRIVETFEQLHARGQIQWQR